MSYETAISRMYALGHELAQIPSHKFDLAHTRVLMEALNHPERKFPSVLIAGTNGKGSTAATLASILKASGLRTGLYTSPHLIRINERIRIEGEAIGDADFTARPVLSSYDAEMVKGATFAVTVEQAGGSPDGAPSSAPVFSGKLIETVPPLIAVTPV